MLYSIKKRKPFIIAVITFVIVFVTLISIYKYFEEKEENQIAEKSNLLMLNIINEIQSKIAKGIIAIDTQIILLKQNDYDTKNFESWAKEILSGQDTIASVQLAENGIVSNVYPYEEHKKALGHDLLHDNRRDDGALMAIQKKDIIFVGPIKLIQNGRYALIARKPVFINNNGLDSFWGFSTVLIYVDNMIKPFEKKIMDSGFEYQLEGFDPDETKRPLFVKSQNYKDKDGIEYDIEVPNGKWIFTLEKK